jgi:uncharacterized protein
MMIRVLAVVALILAWSPAAPAQETDEAAARTEIAARVIERTWNDTRRSIEVMRDQIAATLPMDQRESFRQMLDEYFDFERYKKLNIAMMVRHFSVPELTALDNFYSSPEGQSVMQKMPILLSETVPFAQQLIIDAIRRVPRDKRPPQLRDL